MAIYRFQKGRDGKYLVYSRLGMKGNLINVSYETQVERKDLPAAVARQAGAVKKFRLAQPSVQDQAGEPRSTQ